MRGALLELIAPSVCPACDRPRLAGEPLLCGDPACEPPPRARLGAVLTAFAYEAAGAQLVRRAKFDGRGDALECVAARLAARLAALRFDGIVPVPRHVKRIKSQGGDPAHALARRTARLLGVALWDRVLWRTRPTPPQTELAPRARRSNVAGSFAAAPGALAGRRVLLLDDVVTTGATIAEAARALLVARPRALLLAAAAGTPGAGLPTAVALGYKGARGAGGGSPVPRPRGAPSMASTIRIKQPTTLKAQANLGEEVEEVEFAQGDELTVLKEWAHAWLAKSRDGKLYNVKKPLAEPA
jgi:predicted amidophosphoribosyltransferase